LLQPTCIRKIAVAIPLALVTSGKISVTTQLSTGTKNSVAASLVTRKFLFEILLVIRKIYQLHTYLQLKKIIVADLQLKKNLSCNSTYN
jgi:hypothetical protein